MAAISILPRPTPEDFADYHKAYVDAVADGDILDTLGSQCHALQAFLRGQEAEWGTFRYEPGKWSVKEILGHLIDSERIFCTRALRFARADETELPGFDHAAFVRAARFDERRLTSLLAEYASVRAATIRLYENFREEELRRSGVANRQRVTVHALAWVIAGHERHHQRILRERYVNAVSSS